MCLCVCACKGVTPNKLGLARESQTSTTAVVFSKISYWRLLVAMPGQFPHLVYFIADDTCFSWLRHVLTHIPMQRLGAKRCVHLRSFAKVSSVRPHPRLCSALFSAGEVLDIRIKVRIPHSHSQKTGEPQHDGPKRCTKAVRSVYWNMQYSEVACAL